MLKLAAHAAYRTGVLSLVQSFSRRFEIARSSAGRIAGLKDVTGPKFAIICYHRVGSGGVPFYSGLDPRIFEAQIRFLSRAYRIVSLDDLCDELDSGGPKGQAVAITFDDGYRDVYTCAYPVLRRYKVPATVYLTGSAIESGEISWYDRIFALAMFCRADVLELDGVGSFNLSTPESRLRAATQIVTTLRAYPNRLRVAACSALEAQAKLPGQETANRMLSWTQVREMQESGISFGAHTMDHPVVSRLTSSERWHELAESKRLLEERLQKPAVHFAFPFGMPADIDPETCLLLPQCGYRSAVSTVWGVNTPQTDRFLLRRIGGEEPSLSVFAARLRWLFLNQQRPPEALLALEHALELERTGGQSCRQPCPEAEVQRA